jgi:glycosyltransferase involved in cell wall biosynthesis
MKKLKVCIVAADYPSEESDTAAPWLRESVNALAARGHEVLVVVPSPAAGASPTIDGIRIVRFPYAPRCGWTPSESENEADTATGFARLLISLPYLILGALILTWLAKRERFDLINIHSSYPHGPMALLPSWLLGTKVVATCHGTELSMTERTPLGRRILEWFLRSAHRCGSSNSHVASEVAEICGQFPRIIPYTSTANRLATGKSRRNPQATATLLFNGHLSQRKGLRYLIKALPLVLKKRSVRLLITGTGECRTEWERLVSELGLQNSVNFVGHLSGAELGQLYQTCDIFVLPAVFDEPEDTEGLGLVLIEALINGRPVIATPVGGIVEVIKHKRTGLLVPERSETALARAILRLLEDRLLARQLGRAGRDFATKHFDSERVTGELEKLFYEAVESRPRVRPLARTTPVLASQGAY